MASTVDLDRITEYYEKDQETLDKKIDELVELIRGANYVVFFTGAGVSTSAGVPDYRGPQGAWTMQAKGMKVESKVSMLDAQPTHSHMSQVALLRNGFAKFVITTNLDGLYRKAGLIAHKEFCCLHGDVYAERCTNCNYEFERNWEVRKSDIYVHDHRGYICEKCGSEPSKDKDGDYLQVKTTSTNCGTKDTHINFGESLDPVDWNEAELHCSKADLVIVAGTSMTLRHITHFPFLAQNNTFGNTNSRGKVVIVNLQETPDDEICDLRIFAKTDIVFEGIMKRLGLEIPIIPVWRPRDAKPINQIPKDVHQYYIEKAKCLELVTKMREDIPDIYIGNTHELSISDNNPHVWKIYVSSNTNKKLDEYIEKVVFQLHPTFEPPQVTVTSDPFEVNRVGWGTFPVVITIYWKNGTFNEYKHELCFEKERSERLVHKQEIKPVETETCLVS